MCHTKLAVCGDQSQWLSNLQPYWSFPHSLELEELMSDKEAHDQCFHWSKLVVHRQARLLTLHPSLPPPILARCNVNRIENAMSMSQLLFQRMDPLGLLTCAGAQRGSAHCSLTKLQGLYPEHSAVLPKSQCGIFHISKMILWLLSEQHHT